MRIQISKNVNPQMTKVGKRYSARFDTGSTASYVTSPSLMRFQISWNLNSKLTMCCEIILVAVIFIELTSFLIAVILLSDVISKANNEVALLQSNVIIKNKDIEVLLINVQTIKNDADVLNLMKTNYKLSTDINMLKIAATELEKYISTELSKTEDRLEKFSFQQDLSITTVRHLSRDIVTIVNINTFFPDLSVMVGQTFKSCVAIQQILLSPPVSGNYSIWSSSRNAFIAYCDMTMSCGGVIGGWRRVFNLDMLMDSYCPEGLVNVTRTSRPFKTCRIPSDEGQTCSSSIIQVRGVPYSEVCGRVIAYQYGPVEAFGGQDTNPNIDSFYVDGVSITHGMSPRQHIWTFAAAQRENILPRFSHLSCPCINTDIRTVIDIPSFVGNDYFCDTASITGIRNILHQDDPLWDGAGCGPKNTCCSFNNPPWFYKKLPNPTSDDVEMRVCRDQGTHNKNILVEIVDILVR